MLACVGVYALFLTRGRDRLIQGKFIGSHIISVGVGVGGCYVAAFHIFPSSLAICIGAEDEEMYPGYRVWYQDREDSPKADYLKKNRNPPTPHPYLTAAVLDATSNPTRQKRFILSETTGQTKSPKTTTKSPGGEPRTTSTTPATLRNVSASTQSTTVDQSTEADESTTRSTPPGPHDAPSQQKKIDPEVLPTTQPAFTDSLLNSTVRIPMMGLYSVAMLTMFLLTISNLCGLLGLLCHRRSNRARTTTHPPTSTMDIIRPSTEPTRTTTWEDALSTRGLGGLGRLDTPTPPPLPARKDDLAV